MCLCICADREINDIKGLGLGSRTSFSSIDSIACVVIVVDSRVFANSIAQQHAQTQFGPQGTTMNGYEWLLRLW